MNAGTNAAKAIDTDRAATAECVNAQAGDRVPTRLRVRGVANVHCVLLLHALVHNLMHTFALAPGCRATGEGVPGGTMDTASRAEIMQDSVGFGVDPAD